MQMRLLIRVIEIIVFAWVASVGCSNSGNSVDRDSAIDSASDSAHDTDSLLGSDSTGDSENDTAFDSDDQTFCVPAETAPCDCDSGVVGVTKCAPDGSALGECACVEYGLHLFVQSGSADGDGSSVSPFGSFAEAKAEVRRVLTADGLPEKGIAVWVRGGVYPLAETLDLGLEDSGAKGSPIAWRGYPGETVRVSGGVALRDADFAAVTADSPVWDRLDASARSHIVQIDLAAAGITDYGAHVRRGFCGESDKSPLELFYNGNPLTLARWPDEGTGVSDPDPTGDSVELFGAMTPDVAGTYNRTGSNDDVSVFTRAGLVGGKQYYLYRYFWEFDGSWHRAWFLTTNESGYPADTDPWWSLYSEGFARMNASNGAVGSPVFIEPGAVRHGMMAIASAPSGTEWTYTGTRPERWKNASDVWFHGWWKYPWADCRVASAGIDTASHTVTLADETGYGITPGQPFYAFNLLEEITVPGEWYLDRATGILYLYPPTDPAPSEIVVSTLGSALVRLNNASHVELWDMTFEAGRATLVRIDGGEGNLLNGVVLKNSGGAGATISGTNNGIRNCVISGTATGGVQVSGGDRKTLTPGNNFVENCDIHHFGRTEWTYRPGVSLGGCGLRVQNNLLHNAPHSAILYGGNEHRIGKNEIHHVCEYSSDAGAIYAGRDWGARGNVIENNFIHHINTFLDGYGVHGIYLDDCLSGISVMGNILYEIEDHGILHGGGRDNRMENNIIVNCGDAIAADSRGFDWRPDGGPNNVPGDSWNLLEKLQNVNYQSEPWLSKYPACAAIPSNWDTIIAPATTWLYPQGCTFSRNLGFHNGVFMQGGTTFDSYAEIIDNVENNDPMFVDETALNMTLLPDSPALAIPGFAPIPFAEIGIQRP